MVDMFTKQRFTVLVSGLALIWWHHSWACSSPYYADKSAASMSVRQGFGPRAPWCDKTGCCNVLYMKLADFEYSLGSFS